MVVTLHYNQIKGARKTMNRLHNYVGGEWIDQPVDSVDINPSDVNDVVAEYTQADAKLTLDAIGAASSAANDWARSNIQMRSDILDTIGNNIIARKDELGAVLSREEGKTLPEGVGEVVRAGSVFKFFAGEVLRLTGDLVPSVRTSVDIEITREPVGVVGIISPWNFPAAIPAWKIAPALAFGNTVVFKPATLVPAMAAEIAKIIVDVGLPPGVFNFLIGKGSEVGNTIVNDPRVNAISFTGSAATGQQIAKEAVARMAKFQLEMGGKNPLVVMDDADIDVAVNCAINGAYFSTGQRCTASSRLIVCKNIHDQFVKAMQDRLANTVVDNALKQGTHIGPVVDKNQLDQDLFYIEEAKKEGAKLIYGGNLLTRDTEGFYLEPALFTETENNMKVNQEEVFGPVATVIKVSDYDEALATANATNFGLSSGIVTKSLKYASHFRKNAQAGMVMVNLPTAGVDYHVPFGGAKGSSYGAREQGSYAKEFYTTVKTSYVSC